MTHAATRKPARSRAIALMTTCAFAVALGTAASAETEVALNDFYRPFTTFRDHSEEHAELALLPICLHALGQIRPVRHRTRNGIEKSCGPERRRRAIRPAARFS